MTSEKKAPFFFATRRKTTKGHEVVFLSTFFVVHSSCSCEKGAKNMKKRDLTEKGVKGREKGGGLEASHN
jgi:hypothetical protein